MLLDLQSSCVSSSSHERDVVEEQSISILKAHFFTEPSLIL